jgi:hypothetical protein
MASAALQFVDDIPPPSTASSGSPTQYDTDAAANIVSQYESGNKNIPNYR